MAEISSPQITVRSYNPYQVRCPGFKVVPRETLHLIKSVRAHGYSVKVEPDDGSKLSYLSEKGLTEFLSNPIFLFVIGIPISVITSLVGTWLFGLLSRPATANDADIVIEFGEGGRWARYNHTGQHISDEKFQAIVSSLNQRAQEFSRTLSESSPDPNYPLPVHLEHAPKIVGWASGLRFDDEGKGIVIEGIRITDDETWQRINSGDLQGLSPGGVISSAECQICKEEFVDCIHISGHTYDCKICSVHIKSMCLAEISIVREPVQPLARLHISH